MAEEAPVQEEPTPREWKPATHQQVAAAIEDPRIQGQLPGLPGDVFALLGKNIVRDGQRDPICLGIVDGKVYVVDGHHRLKVCREQNMPPKCVVAQFKDMAEVLTFVFDTQDGRRNWNPGQRALLVAPFKDEFAVPASARMLGGKPVPERDQGRAVEMQARISGAGKTTQHKANVVHEEAPDLVPDVMEEKTSLNNAYKTVIKRRRAAPVVNPIPAGTGEGNAAQTKAREFPTVIVNVPWDEMPDEQIRAWRITKVTADRALLWLPAPADRSEGIDGILTAWGFSSRCLLQAAPTEPLVQDIHIAEKNHEHGANITWNERPHPDEFLKLIRRFASPETLVVNPGPDDKGVAASVVDNEIIVQE